MRFQRLNNQRYFKHILCILCTGSFVSPLNGSQRLPPNSMQKEWYCGKYAVPATYYSCPPVSLILALTRQTEMKLMCSLLYLYCMFTTKTIHTVYL